MDRLLRDGAGMRASTAGSPPSRRGAKCLARRLQSLDLVLRGKKSNLFFSLTGHPLDIDWDQQIAQNGSSNRVSQRRYNAQKCKSFDT